MDEEGPRRNDGIRIAGALLLAFLILQWIAPSVPVPRGVLGLADVVATLLFLGIPLSIAYQAGKTPPIPGVTALVFVLTGSVVAFIVMADQFGTRVALNPVLMSVVGQACIVASATSLGLLVASLIKDSNLLLPIAPVLAIVDIVSVLSPVGFTRHVLQTAPSTFQRLAVAVPRFGHAAPIAYMGPADVLFLTMFFAVLHRAGFRARTSYLWLVPTMVLYMLVVFFFGGVKIGAMSLGSLPALVPMGAVILAVNWRCFTLNRQEKAMTGVLLVVAVALAAAAFSMHPK